MGAALCSQAAVRHAGATIAVITKAGKRGTGYFLAGIEPLRHATYLAAQIRLVGFQKAPRRWVAECVHRSGYPMLPAMLIYGLSYCAVPFRDELAVILPQLPVILP